MADDSPADRWRLVRGADIPASLRLTLYALHCFQGNNRTAFCKRETLADEVGVNVDNLSRKLTALEQLNVIRSVWTQRHGRPSREHMIDYSKLKKMQRSTLTNATEWQASTLTIPTVHSDECDSCTLTNSSDMKIHRRSKNNPKVASLPFSFPESLNNEKFAAAWNEWIQFRKEIKKKLTPSTISMQLAKLESWGSDAAVQSIEKSISQGWQGLFLPDGKQGGKAPGSSQDAGEALNRVCTGLRKHDYETDHTALRAFIGEQAWKAAAQVGWKKIRDKDPFTEKQIRIDFETAWEAQA